MSTMRKMGDLVNKCNNGKGKPLTYVMFPLSSPAFRHSIGLEDSKVPSVRNLDEGRIVQVVQVFDHITELRQKIHDQVVELNNHSRCVRSSELKEARSLENRLEIQQATVKSDLVRLRKEVHSVNSDSQCLEAFCDEQFTTANEKFSKMQSIYQAVQPRIMFAEDCEKYGAKYIEHPIQQRIDRACDEYENVYVLFDGEADDETTGKNQTAFKVLAKSRQNDSTTAFYFTWTDPSGHVKIEHYRKSTRVSDDVAKELETKNMVQCIPTARRALRLMPFKVRCPGSYCSREELPWTCINCNEMIQFCPYEVSDSLYCGCGHAKMQAHQFQFRCGSKDHGSDFAQFRNNELHEHLKSSASRYGTIFVDYHMSYVFNTQIFCL